MRHVFILTFIAVLWTTAAYAQEPRGYVVGSGALSRLNGATTGGVDGEVGIKVRPNLVFFGNVGDLRNLHSSSLQSSVDDTVSGLSATNGLTATATAKVPTWYSMGGARLQFPNHSEFTPYVFGGVGFARMNPSVRFLYQDGTSLNGNTDVTGQDITADVTSSGLFTTPAPSTSLMLRTGAGVQIPIGKYLLGNVGYSVSRISTATPIHAQEFTFGMGVKF